MGNANYSVKENTTWYKFENWQAEELKSKKICKMKEGEKVEDSIPTLFEKIKILLAQNPIETIVDFEEEDIIVEKWVANDGDLYMEFDSSIRNQFPHLENDEFLKTVYHLKGY